MLRRTSPAISAAGIAEESPAEAILRIWLSPYCELPRCCFTSQSRLDALGRVSFSFPDEHNDVFLDIVFVRTRNDLDFLVVPDDVIFLSITFFLRIGVRGDGIFFVILHGNFLFIGARGNAVFCVIMCADDLFIFPFGDSFLVFLHFTIPKLTLNTFGRKDPIASLSKDGLSQKELRIK